MARNRFMELLPKIITVFTMVIVGAVMGTEMAILFLLIIIWVGTWEV